MAVVIEDDKDIRGALRSILTASGFTVHECSTGVEGVDAVARYGPHIVTLDLGLPDIDGFEVARRIRLFSDTYIIMLTALTEELDTLQGLEAGADDYLTKPFRPRELRARVAALLRRPRGLEAAKPASAERVLVEAPVPVPASRGPLMPEASLRGAPTAHDTAPRRVWDHNGLRLDPSTRTTEVAGVEVVLTRTEFDLLEALLEGGRIVRSKADLARRLHYEEYGTGSYVSEADEKVVEVHVANLRRKLGDNPRLPRWLETVRGVGYRMTPGATAS
ncbi:response regulator transcription factor [Arthrobacter sp. PsM3]|uniref:response regulator transcription factor n=1 Tax=Arthrobacter sp. PsM3 TaxID=3030531 RepID=UPI00263A677E|nr:response regulator transcription factor [Arthrobacter sp. PsM3]MDN4645116.1 response regulator transcription factor [Arthrobacter sp. PsM3]